MFSTLSKTGSESPAFLAGYLLLASGFLGPVGGIQRELQTIQPLPAPLARSARGFTSIFDLAELPDGRVLITDNTERVLALVDLAGESVTTLGREGEGPGEYRSVFTILPQPGNRFFVYDATLRRFLVVKGDGAVAGTEPLDRPPLSGFSPPRGPDDAGNLYISHRQISVSPPGLLPEAILYRWSPGAGTLDSVAAISNYAPGQEGPGFVPMPREDAWTFLDDGTVGLLVASDYHLEWHSPDGDETVGPAIPHPRVRVGDREREEWIDALYARSAGGSSRMEGGDAASASREHQRREVDPDRFPEFIPPFEGGFIPAAPWGHVWVRSRTLSDSTRTVFDVLDRQGSLARRVSVEGEARVLGYGRGSVYLARRDEVDLEWLERYSGR